MAVVAGQREAEVARLRDLGHAVATAVDEALDARFSALRVLASSRLLDELPVDLVAFHERSLAVAQDLDAWVVLQGPPPDYRTLANSRSANPGVAPPQARPSEVADAIEGAMREIFERRRRAVSNLFIGPVVGQMVFAVFVPVIRDEHVFHALSLGQTPSGLRQLLLNQRLGDSTFAFILDGNHRVVANSLPDGEALIGHLAPAWMRAGFESSSPTTMIGRGLRFGDNVYTLAPINQAPGWRLVVARPVKDVAASALQSAPWLSLGGLALALSSGIMVWLVRSEQMLETQRTAETHRAARAKVERVLAGVPAMIFLRAIGPDGTSRLLYRAGDLEAVTGWPTSEIVGLEHFDHLLHPDDASLTQMGPRFLRAGSVSHEWRMRQPDGGWRRLHTVAHVLSHLSDGGVEIVGYTVDVTAQRDMEARARASARLASVGEMAAGLAHEIKQPLTIISLAAENAEAALDQGDVPYARSRLQRITLQAQRTASLIDRLRLFARKEQDGAPLEAIPLASAVNGAIDLTRPVLRDALVTLQVDLGDPPSTVLGQPLLLEQVLTNLLLNARDALTHRPGTDAARRIRIAAAPGRGRTVRLTVSDNGGGIAPEVMGRLFEPFVTTKSPDHGTGLGLSLCHGLITSMGGTITARNDAHGAVFTITLNEA